MAMPDPFDWKQVIDDKTAMPDADASVVIDPVSGQPLPFDPDRPVPASVHALDTNENYLRVEDGGATAPGDPETKTVADLHLDELLRMAVERQASDIHITSGLPPTIRVDGELVALSFQTLTPQDTRRLIYETLSNDNLTKFESTHELDFGYSVKGVSRFRFNVYMQRGSVSGALRAIPTKIPTFDSLGLPAVVREMAKRSSGLILVTGPTGSGKTTTIATMIDDINENRRAHILTIEDPIEYLHQHKKCMVNQREMHSDTFSFHNSLRAVLREDP
ncbi:MAG: Flp pilus assembly complex ATPase component TadA, partial [Fimbriimonas ginsengisoli]|nr:Flp pilus assembly complex ATPase component TadA [Fimbriimonas ginsengisoli]